MDVKIDCHCGTRYGFDVEPEDGRMPSLVACPRCGTDGTTAANAIIRSQLEPNSNPRPMRVSLATHATGAAAAPSQPPAQARMAPATHVSPAHSTAPSSFLDRSQFFVKERAALLKLVNTYDILDPNTQQNIGLAKEEPPAWAKYLRLLTNPQMLPTAINVYAGQESTPIISLRRGFTLLRARVHVSSGGRTIGCFRTKWFSLRGGFRVLDSRDQVVAELKGNWKGWDFRFLNNSGREIGLVTKKWAGMGRELFTSADNYLISISDPSGAGADTVALLLAAGLAVDTLFKEKGGAAGLSGLLGGN